MVHLYRPRMLLRLTIALPRGRDWDAWDPLTFDVAVSKARLVSNDHNQADTLDVTVDWIDTGVDPRYLTGATCEFYLGDADELGRWNPGPDSLRFVGRLVEPARSIDGDRFHVELKFHDYTDFFLLAKPFADDGVPLFTETLSQAWARICKHTPGAEELGDNIEFRGFTKDVGLGDAVGPRFRGASAKVPVQPGTDAWGVWQRCVGAMGLISFVWLDRCVITTDSDYYNVDGPVRFVWGQNILNLSERRNLNQAPHGVGVASFDSMTGTTLEVFYDPNAGKRKPAKAPSARKRSRRHSKSADNSPLAELKSEDFIQYAGVTDPVVLERIARRIYAERARQALQGSLTTVEMRATTTTGIEKDLLELRSGDTIEIRLLDTEDESVVKQFPTRESRTEYLMEKGYSPQVAQIIAANVERLGSKSTLYYVRSVTTEFEVSAEGGSFQITVEFCNKIDVGDIEDGA